MEREIEIVETLIMQTMPFFLFFFCMSVYLQLRYGQMVMNLDGCYMGIHVFFLLWDSISGW